MWYDDPESLGPKFAQAKVLGLRGVGFWHLDALDYTGREPGKSETQAMWDAVKQFSQA